MFYECELNYITPRGKWYDYSWKGNCEKSGGILYNILVKPVQCYLHINNGNNSNEMGFYLV